MQTILVANDFNALGFGGCANLPVRPLAKGFIIWGMSNPWNLEAFRERVVEIVDCGNMEELVELEGFLMSSVALSGGVEKISRGTRKELGKVVELLNNTRAVMDQGENVREIESYLKDRGAYLDPNSLVLRGWRDKEWPTQDVATAETIGKAG